MPLYFRLAFVGLFLTVAQRTSVAAEDRPNFVIIIADDMSWDDCGAYGHPTIKTPHIDRLASEGIRFDNALLTISSCSPSRASIITGRYPHLTDAEELHWPLPKNKTTFTEILRTHGYWCGAAGKWHLGDAVKDRFDRVIAADTSGFQLPTGKAGETGTFVESVAGDVRSGCADWIRLLQARPKDKPFCLWLAALDPHRPYDDNMLEGKYSRSDVRLPPYHPDTDQVRDDYINYYNEITRLDRFVGRVMRELETQKIVENTFVLFFSDNGRPFPRDKTTLYESGIRTPFIVRFPAKAKAGSVAKNIVSVVDIAPTVLDLANCPAPQTFDGKTFAPQLEDPGASTRSYAFAEKNWHDFEDHVRAVRDVRFKYIRNYYHDLPNTPPADAVRSPTYIQMQALLKQNMLTDPQLACFTSPRAKEELYDVVQDPHELNNLAGNAKFTVDLKRMRNALKQWEFTTGDAVPELRTADEFDRVNGKPTPARRRPRWDKAKMVAEGLVAP